MKRWIAMLLAAVLMMSAFVITTGAENPPDDPPPFDYTGRTCVIQFVKINPETGMTEYIINGDDWIPVRKEVFFNGTLYEDIPAGVSYDPDSHILTLDNVNMPEWMLWVSDMDYQFTIDVKGSCSLARIDAMSESVGQSLRFVGDGTLDVNKNKVFYGAISLNAARFGSAVHFGPYVTVNLYYAEGENSCAVAVDNSAVSNPSDVYRFEGEHNGTMSSREVDNRWEISKEIEGYVLRSGNPGWMGYRVNNPADPNGIYVAIEFEQTENGVVVGTGWDLYHLIYNEALDVYLYDPAFGSIDDGYRSYGMTYTEQEFADAGFSVNIIQDGENAGNKEVFYNRCEVNLLTNCSVVLAKNGKRYASTEIWDNEAEESTTVYSDYSPIPDGNGLYQFRVLRDQSAVEVEEVLDDVIDGYVLGDAVYDDGLIECEGWRVTAPGHENELLMLTEGEFYDFESDSFIQGYRLYRMLYIASIDDYLIDKQFGEYGPYVEMTQQQVDEAGIAYLTDNEGNRVQLFTKHFYGDGRYPLYEDAQGNQYAVDDPYYGGKICTFAPIPELEDQQLLTPTDAVTIDQLSRATELFGDIDYELTLKGENGLFSYHGGEPVFPERIMGDPDRDGVVTILDATAIQRVLAHMISEQDIDMACGDIDGNGLDTLDATAIQRWLAKVDTNNGIGGPMPSPENNPQPPV